MKIINVVLNNFTNDSRVEKISDSLARAGHVVKVVALEGPDLAEHEIRQNYDVQRISLISKPWPKNKFIQLFKYIEFLFKSVKLHRNAAEVVHCNDLNALPVGFLIKKLSKNNVKIIYDAHEYETETNGQKPINRFFKKRLEDFLIKHVDKVITVSPKISLEYSRLYNIQKPAVVLNCPNFIETNRQNFIREALGLRDTQKIFLYQGSLSPGRGIELALAAFEQLPDNNKVLVCMGYGPLEHLIKLKSTESLNIHFLPAVSPSNLLTYTSSADYGISFIEDTCLSYRYCLPNKVFEYLMAGIPVIVSNLPELSKLVNENGVGVVANDYTDESVTQALNSILNLDYSDLSKNIEMTKKKYKWEQQEKTLLEVYSKL